jgi:hypothetical protein
MFWVQWSKLSLMSSALTNRLANSALFSAVVLLIIIYCR